MEDFASLCIEFNRCINYQIAISRAPLAVHPTHIGDRREILWKTRFTAKTELKQPYFSGWAPGMRMHGRVDSDVLHKLEHLSELLVHPGGKMWFGIDEEDYLCFASDCFNMRFIFNNQVYMNICENLP